MIISPSSIWIDIDEAARRSGRNPGHLRRLARRWVGEGLARVIQGAGKRPYYEVREDADVDFGKVKRPEQIGGDLTRYTQAQRDEAARRRGLLTRWEAAKRASFTLGYDADAATGRFLQQLLIDENIKLSRATLYNWDKAWRSEGLEGLIDRRGARATEVDGRDDPFIEEVKRLYLGKRKLKLTLCHEIAALKAEESGWEVRSYKTCQRAVGKIHPHVVLKHRHGEEAFTNLAEPYVERTYRDLAANQIWCGDHHQFDLVVNADGKLVRPWLTAWQDIRSRRLVGWVIRASDPNTDSILCAFRAGCLAVGVPRGVCIDNGKDYDSYALNGRTKKERWAQRTFKVPLEENRAGVFTMLDISVQHVWPYHGQSKPIERFFGTLAPHLRLFDTFCGNCPTDRPEDLQLALERGKAPTLADFVAWFDQWAASFNARPSDAVDLDGQSPDACFAATLDELRTTTAEILDAMCLRRTPPVKVQQNGVVYKGLHYGQYETALQRRLGQSVVLAIDDRDVSSFVQVWTAEGQFICLAPANKRIGFAASAEELSAALKEKGQARKTANAYFEQRPRMADDLPDAILRARAAKLRREAAGNAPVTPGPAQGGRIVPLRTLIDDQLPALRRAIEQQQNAAALRPTGTDGGDKFVYRPAQDAAAHTPADSGAGGAISFRELMAARTPSGE